MRSRRSGHPRSESEPADARSGLLEEVAITAGVGSLLQVDPSGVEAFLRLAAQKEVDACDIESFLQLPPNSRMASALSHTDVDLARVFRLGLLHDSTLGESAAEDPMAQRMAEAVRFAREQRERVAELLTSVREGLSPESIVRRVREYLPCETSTPAARITLLVGLAQGMQSGGDLLIDLPLALILRPRDPLGNLGDTIAHELHHYWRESLEPEPHSDDARFRGIAWALEQLEGEGIAMALVDAGDDPCMGILRDAEGMVRFFGEAARDVIEGWTAIYKGGHVAALARLEKAWDGVLEGSVGAEGAVECVLSVLDQNTDHPVGHMMAHRIGKALGRAALVQCVRRPFLFLRTYQRAARQSVDGAPAHVFDDRIIQRLAESVFPEVAT